VRTGKLADALGAYGKALAIFEKIADANPDNTGWLSNLAWSQIAIGRVYALDKRFTDALPALDTGLAILLKRAQREPKNADVVGELPYGYALRGWARVRAGMNAAAATDLRRAAQLEDSFSHVIDDGFPQGYQRLGLAQALALLAGLRTDPKSGVTALEASKLAERAVAALRDALEAGWGNAAELKEPDFDALRGRDDFKKLVAEVEARSGPRAKLKD
jgi:tetratricopeptide (TPR) repeat protein